jgi:predicted enzyme related to lactoylglutathione lyase
MDPIGRLGWIQIDAHDPLRLAAFWGSVLGRPVSQEPLGDPPHYVGLVSSADALVVCFQRVPEEKTVKNRLHLDIQVDDVDGAQTAIEAIGGRHLPTADFHEYGFSWRQMADPEGNEFCLIFGTV